MHHLFSRPASLRFLLVASIFLAAFAPPAKASPTEPSEVYATASDGTLLHWVVYTPDGIGPWPAILVIHGGGFKGGTPTSSP